ncbi:hypothetical protein L249_6652, partial [Ophiocordyceps polyrhachis-furcata BCC 54312]
FSSDAAAPVRLVGETADGPAFYDASLNLPICHMLFYPQLSLPITEKRRNRSQLAGAAKGGSSFHSLTLPALNPTDGAEGEGGKGRRVRHVPMKISFSTGSVDQGRGT